jgi:two-component system chemotaxis sensor kinase CheA
VRIEKLFELSNDKPPPRRCFVVVVGLAQHRVGLVVDELVGQEDIVVKSLGKALDGTPGIAGATELGGKRTVLVLDVAALVEEATALRTTEAA